MRPVEIDRSFTLDEARLMDVGSRRLFNKSAAALLEDFDRVGKAPPIELIDTLIAVGKRVESDPTPPAKCPDRSEP